MAILLILESPNTILVLILQSPNIIFGTYYTKPNIILALILQSPNVILACYFGTHFTKSKYYFWHLFYKTYILFLATTHEAQ